MTRYEVMERLIENQKKMIDNSDHIIETQKEIIDRQDKIIKKMKELIKDSLGVEL